MTRAAGPGFRAARSGLLRAPAGSFPGLPSWPGPARLAADAASSAAWLRRVWRVSGVAEAVGHASPVLAQRVESVCRDDHPSARDAWRASLAVARYLRRMTARPTPFGFMAGVTLVSFDAGTRLRWGGRHRVVARAGAEWLAAIIARLEDCTELLLKLPVAANSILTVRGDRLVVPHQPSSWDRGSAAAEITLRYTEPVRAAVEAARAPIRVDDLVAKIGAQFSPAASVAITAMLRRLVSCRVLITSLHAPATEPDALTWLVRQLDEACAADVPEVFGLVTAVGEIRVLLAEHDHAAADAGSAMREAAVTRMRAVVRTPQHPLAIDVRLDAEVTLPAEVAREAERAVLLLARLSAFPTGIPAWRAYHQRFYERYGIGSLVPVLDVVADSGVGWPGGYPGTVTADQHRVLSGRDRQLLSLAQRAALDRADEVVLDDELIAALELGPGKLRLPPHVEASIRVGAYSLDALAKGDFRLQVVMVSRGAGVLTGRFLTVLADQDRTALGAALADLPGADLDTEVLQLSFPALDPAAAHVTRTPQILPTVISMAEHRDRGGQVLTAEDLAVGCDGRRMFLAAPGRGRHVEATTMHALNLCVRTPPLARFVTELSRAQCAQVTAFDWGPAASLPFLPRLVHGRSILSPARWRLEAGELPSRSSWSHEWDRALERWRGHLRVPAVVHLAEGDQRLPLDLDQVQDRALLRAHLNAKPTAILTEAPGPADLGWCAGRPHEIIVPLTATEPASWPRLPRPSPARVIGREHGRMPGTAPVLLVSLYGDPRRQDVILAEYLPDLLASLGHPDGWWYVRYRDPSPNLRLRIPLPGQDTFGQTVHAVSDWAGELRSMGLLSELRYLEDRPETGRWGSGQAWDAAAMVFGADSRAVLTQLRQPDRPGPQALAAVHAVSIAISFTGSIAAGMRWVIEHVAAGVPTRIPRDVLDQARQVADPRDDWKGLRSVPGGAAIVGVWQERDQALSAYRGCLPGPGTVGVDADDVLSSLIHVNYVRACGIDFPDEAECMYLARAAALAWTARTRSSR
jgi:lantibiotic biosynthesis protein